VSVTTRPAVQPGAAARFALLATSTLGVMSSTVMSAPINDIAAGIGVGPQQIVLAVSAFTVAMVVFAPLAGWLAERLGMTRFLVGSLVLMVVGQAGAAMADGLGVLVLMRAVQGVACSGVPPAIQQGMVTFWPERRAASMGAWATANGLGQAIGPPLGGLVSELLGWRWLFGLYAAVCLVVLLVVGRTVPSVAAQRPPFQAAGMTQLVGGGGLVITTITWAGQGGDPRLVIPLGLAGCLLLGWALRPRPGGDHLLGREVRGDRGFVAGTVTGLAGMAAMGITMVSVPLYLGREVGLPTGVIGATVVAVAAGMSAFGPVAGRIGGRYGPLRTLTAGLLALAVAAIGIGSLEVLTHRAWVVAPLLVLLLVVGCGLATVQSMSALVMLGSAGRRGVALGAHNMGRFSGLALGYAWVAGVHALGVPPLAHLGVVALAVAGLLTVRWCR